MNGTRLAWFAIGTAVVSGSGVATMGRSAWWPSLGHAMAQAAPVADIDIYNSGYPIERSACLSVSLGQSAGSECGNLRVVHPLPSTRVFNTDVTPTLLYNSEFAHPYLTVPVTIKQLAGTTQPDSVDVELWWGAFGATKTRRARAAWLGTEWPAGVTTTRRVTVRLDSLIGDTTGVYAYAVVAANWYGGTRQQQGYQPSGGYHLVNRSDSPYGAGWWLAGHEQVKKYYQSGGTTALLWIGGDGSTRTFTVGQAMYYDRRDSIMYDPVTLRWVRKLPEGRRVEFDPATGLHIRTVNRFGRVTQFVYGGTPLKLDSLKLPTTAPRAYAFTYAGNRLTSVTAPMADVARITLLTNTGGNITQIRNAGDSIVGFAYYASAAHQYLMNQRTARTGTPTSFTFDSALKVRTASVAPGVGGAMITQTLVAGESRGLPRSGTPSSVDTSKVYTWVDGPRPVADTTALFQGRFGEMRRMVDAVGAVTQVRAQAYYDGWQFGWKPSRVRRPGGQVVLYEWDMRGNVLREIDSTGTTPGVRDTTAFVYDTTYDQLTHHIPPLKDTLFFGVNAANGRRDWQQDTRGVPSRITYGYDPTYAEQVTSVQLPVVGGVSATYSYTYFPGTRNAKTETTPLGYTTTWTEDSIGRTTRLEQPIDSLVTSTKREVRAFTYSLRGDRWYEQTLVTGGSAEQILVHSYFDADGLVTRVERALNPDPAAIGTMTTQWRRDNIGRPYAVQAPDGRVDSTVFNEIGKPVQWFSRRYAPSNPGSAQAVTTVYDVLGRDSIRNTPALSYAARLVGIPTRWSIYGLDSAYRAYTIPAVADSFLYDAEGRMISARNRWARVTRTYKRNGRDSTETQDLADVAGAFGAHTFRVGFTTDRNGRRIKTAVPSQLVPAAKDTMRIAYGAWGQDSLITDVDGGQYRYTYTARGEPENLVYLTASVTQAWTYDADGRLKASTVSNGTGFPRWSYAQLRNIMQRFDGRGKLLQRISSVAMIDSLQLQYTDLGTMWWSRASSIGISQLWGTYNQARTISVDSIGADPLGNTYTGWQQDWSKLGNNPPVAAPVLPRPATYVAGVGRLATQGAAIPGIRTFTYDSAGNEAFASLRGHSGGNNRSEDRASYYDAAGQLVAAESRALTSEIDPTQGLRNTFEEYRRDALGRRVWVRARRRCQFEVAGLPEPGGESIACSRSFVRRTVWDGVRELAEIQMPDTPASRERDGTVHDSLPLLNGKDPNPYYGRVVYTYGLALDQPLAIYRLGYADKPIGGGFTATWGNFVLHPIWEETGEARIGVFGNGAAVRQLVAGGTACGVGVSQQRCVKQYWAESFTPRDRLHGFTAASYMGSLLEGKRNTTGTEYKRARVYDPQSGRFTQEDPIGLAGGLNLYGYANGDPVNFSDPFGLCPWCVAVAGEVLYGAAVGGITGAIEQVALNKLSGRPTWEGVGETAAIGAGVGAVTAGAASAGRVFNAVRKAGRAVGFAEAEVATTAEANAAAETFAGKGARPMVERSTGRQVGVRNDATGNQGRYVHTDKSMRSPHANLENSVGGNTHVKVNPWWPFR
ncbi:MAG: RHS repeat-associated core domain-containing protein [Gemmatimonadaceae bacterium]|nr:RHS repeat-associated core domain-containing protein [Gemmatimonadaceae bacterium]